MEGPVNRSKSAEGKALVDLRRDFTTQLAELREIAEEHGVDHEFPDDESVWSETDYSNEPPINAPITPV